MEKIKFRSYVKSSNCYMLLRIVENFDDTGLVITGADDDVILEQFTGLLDIRDHEIYEGDIIQCGEHQLYAVKYREGRFACSNDGRIWLKSVAKRGKVVGNIHENPELLEEENK